jgi:hypothetical protein
MVLSLAPDALSPLGGYPGNDDGVENYKKTNSGGNARTSLQPTIPKHTKIADIWIVVGFVLADGLPT